MALDKGKIQFIKDLKWVTPFKDTRNLGLSYL